MHKKDNTMPGWVYALIVCSFVFLMVIGQQGPRLDIQVGSSIAAPPNGDSDSECCWTPLGKRFTPPEGHQPARIDGERIVTWYQGAKVTWSFANPDKWVVEKIEGK